MKRILHISDLHLGPVTDDFQITGDYKAQQVPLSERQNRHQMLTASLEGLALYLREQELSLDAVIVTGDITYRHNEQGFEEFDGVLAHLGEKRPPNDRVVVVPGNHDIKQGTPPSSPERYALFIQYIVDAGYITPLLDGVDIDQGGAFVREERQQPLLVDEDRAFTVVALNSANYSGGTEPLRHMTIDQMEEIETALTELQNQADLAPEQALMAERLRLILTELAHHRGHDPARISPAQLTAVSRALSAQHEETDGTPLTVLALHHHLLPVSLDEEFKSFENLSNLGQLRALIASHRIGVVAHGHKHHPRIIRDFPADLQAQPQVQVETRDWVYISAAGTVGQQVGAGREIARLIEVDGALSHVRRVRISSVPALQPGSIYTKPPHVLAAFVVGPEPAEERVIVFEGADIDETYQKIVAHFEQIEARPETMQRNVVTRISDGASARSLPADFPPMPGEDDLDAWLEDIVGWWQRPQIGLSGPYFNHGQRLRSYDGGHDQIDTVVKALASEARTTRAVALVLDPRRDKIDDTRNRMPSFCLAHFLIDEQRQHLDCIGYFRRQQMQTWWPVNVAELASLQAEVVEGLRALGKVLRAGEIITISAVAVWGTGRPRVMVPKVDRLAAEAPEKLIEHAYDIFESPPYPAREWWQALFADWLPPDVMEPDGVPVATDGIELLEKVVSMIANRRSVEPGRVLGVELKQLLLVNRSYAQSEDEPGREHSARVVRFNDWREQVAISMDKIVAATEGLASGR